MNITIVAYSLSGNTAACAFALAKILDCGVFLLEEVNPRYGKSVFFTGGLQAVIGSCARLKALPDFTNIDVVLLGMPVWAGTTPPAINTLLHHAFLRGKKVFVFATHLGGGVSEKLENRLRMAIEGRGGKYMGLFVQQASKQKQLSVENALEPAREWAKTILATDE